jgi:hypothetical protein
MLQDTKVEKKVRTKKPLKASAREVIVIVQPKNELMFSEEFLRMMEDHVFETLRTHLVKTKQDKAVNLLDDLIILCMRSYQREMPTWLQSQFMCEAIASASKNILLLGGHFSMPGKAAEILK